MKAAAILLVLIAAFLIYAVIHALGSAGGAKAGVSVGYIVAALVLGYVASMLWRRSGPRAARVGG